MRTTDREIRVRLSHAVDSIPLDVERRLVALHRSAGMRSRARRATALALALLVGGFSVFVGWRLLPRGSGRTPAAAPSPTGQILYSAFAASGEESDIHLFDVANGHSSPLVTGPDFAFMPVWSPDGSRVAFAADREGCCSFDVFISNADGSNPVPIAQGTSAISLTWSSDGQRLAFVASGSGGRHNVYVVNADGTGEQLILLGNWESVSWSPDGTRLLVAGFPDSPSDAGHFDLYTVRPDGSELTQLTDDEAADKYAEWSPDGTNIAFARNERLDDADYQWDVFVVRTDGESLTKLTDWKGFDSFPIWSPDGAWLVFSSDRGASPDQRERNAGGRLSGGLSLYMMRADGSGVRLLVDAADSGLFAATSWRS